MSIDTEAAVRRVLDRAAISDLILRYSRGVDQKDWDQVASCFAPDAHLDYRLFRGGVEEVVASIRKGVEVFERTMHFMEPWVIEVTGDRASAETYGIAYHRRNHEGKRKELLVRQRYLDELVRHGGEWLIQTRTVEYLLGREDEVVLPGD